MNVTEHANAETRVTWDLSQSTCVNFYYLKWTLDGCTESEDENIVDDPNGVVPSASKSMHLQMIC